MVNQCPGCVRDSLKAGAQRWAGFPFANLQMRRASQGTERSLRPFWQERRGNASRAWKIEAGTDVSSLRSQRSCFAWGENRPGGLDSRGFPEEVWCLPLSLAVRCFCASQKKVCVLRIEERKQRFSGCSGAFALICYLWKLQKFLIDLFFKM